MNFLQDIKSSIYSPVFYQSVPKKTLWQSIKYFLLLSLFLTVTVVVSLFQNLFIETPILMQNLAKDTLNCFPNELEIKISKGVVSTNVEEPYLISSYSCNIFTDVANMAGTSFNFAVIDTKTPFSQAKFEEYNASIWLTKDSLVVKDRNYSTRLYSLTQVDNLTLTKNSIESVYNKFSPYLKFVGPILLILAFLVILLVYLFKLLQLLLTAS